MTRSQRIVVVLYCLLVVYCCTWVPWHIVGHPRVGEIQLGSRWLWTVDSGGPNLAGISLRLLAGTALAVAAFLLSRNWKILLCVITVLGLTISGILLNDYRTQRADERRTQAIHECAIATVAKMVSGCTSYPKTPYEVCDPPKSEADEETAVKAAEKDCAGSLPLSGPASIHQQLETYRHQHGISE
jgi:hypothetical protein